jgi:hypothetical protein
MLEQEWLAGSDLEAMLHQIRETGSDRKVRLFACACCRRVWHLLTDRRSQEAVAVAEAYADGQADKLALREACQEAFQAITRGRLTSSAEGAAQACAEEYRAYPLMTAATLRGVAPEESKSFPLLLSCVFGNPFRAVSMGPAWRTTEVVRLAQAAYDERVLPSGELHPDRLAVLADALEEGGAAGDLLNHLREPGPHCRGCFAVDACLGRA